MSTVTSDPIADMLTRIRNAIAVGKTDIHLPHSKAKEAVARLLQSNRYIDDVQVQDVSIGKTLHLSLHPAQQNARITEIVRLSKPGRRLYTSADNMPNVKQGRGLVIVSTSKGMMTGDDAKRERVGGELICKIY